MLFKNWKLLFGNTHQTPPILLDWKKKFSDIIPRFKGILWCWQIKKGYHSLKEKIQSGQ